MPVLDELALYLEQQGHGTRGTDLFAGQLPDDPDTLVSLFETPGAALLASLVDQVEERSVQVRARAASYAAARTKAEAIYALLHGKAQATLGGGAFTLIEAKQPPFSLGRDVKQRQEMAFTLRVLWRNPDR